MRAAAKTTTCDGIVGVERLDDCSTRAQLPADVVVEAELDESTASGSGTADVLSGTGAAASSVMAMETAELRSCLGRLDGTCEAGSRPAE